MIRARTHPYGEGALYVDLRGTDDEEVWRATHRLAARVQLLPHILNVVPTYSTVFIEVDLAMSDLVTAQTLVDALLHDDPGHGEALREPRRFEIPVVYGGERGPDLTSVSHALGITEEAVIEAHSAHPLHVRCLAGPVGGPMMSGPDFPLPVPRQTSPRAFVEAGAVLLAGKQSFLKTMPGPGGWQIIGRTPLRLIDLGADPLVPWTAGDTIQFRPIAEAKWASWEGARPHGS